MSAAVSVPALSVPLDTTGDGAVDSIAIDTTGDGTVDAVVPWAVSNAAATKMQALARGRAARSRSRRRSTHIEAVAKRFARKRESSMDARTRLDDGTDEYTKVVQHMHGSLSPSELRRMRIVTVERLHVRDTRDQYDLMLVQMSRREEKRKAAGKGDVLDASSLEIAWVFHACAADVVDNIICGGFNRSYAGKNATVFGPGVYFARDASYSMSETYSPTDANGLKRMFLCRLAVGAHTMVSHGYYDKEPPVRDAERLLGVGMLRYDTTTNGRLSAAGVPEIMVAYRDNQAYAEYLVTFRMS